MSQVARPRTLHRRSMDSECSPDADAPRPIGVGLLLCMLENGDEAVANALTQLATRLQQQPPSPESILMREACYRCEPGSMCDTQSLCATPPPPGVSLDLDRVSCLMMAVYDGSRGASCGLRSPAPPGNVRHSA